MDYVQAFLETVHSNDRTHYMMPADVATAGLSAHDKTDGLNTEALSPIAATVVYHKSSIGFQALAAGKPVIFIAEDTYTNPVIDYQIATRVPNATQLAHALEAISTEQDAPSLEKMGVPGDAIGAMHQVLSAHL